MRLGGFLTLRFSAVWPPEFHAEGQAYGELQVRRVRGEAYTEAEVDGLARRVHVAGAEAQRAFDQVRGWNVTVRLAGFAGKALVPAHGHRDVSD